MMKIFENIANQSIIIFSRHFFEVEDEMIQENMFENARLVEIEIINRTECNFVKGLFHYFHLYIGVFNLRYLCQYFAKFIGSQFI